MMPFWQGFPLSMRVMTVLQLQLNGSCSIGMMPFVFHLLLLVNPLTRPSLIGDMQTVRFRYGFKNLRSPQAPDV